MCGIFGYIGKNPDPLKIKVLGMYNQSRGSHSCGLFYNNEVRHGIGTQKEWFNFIENNELGPITSGNKVIIGHTRHATQGAHTVENAHPFELASGLVGVHNGTLHNDYELSKAHGLETAGKPAVDSWKLYSLIDSVGLSILEEYKGFAALLWTNKNNPNVMYAYHGASRKNETDETVYIERPLYAVSWDGGYYFSSMENSLKIITSFDAVITSLDCNNVYEFKVGLKPKIIHKVNRIQVFSDKPYYNSTNYYNSKNYNAAPSEGKKNLPATATIAATYGPVNVGINYPTAVINKSTPVFSQGGRYLIESTNKNLYVHGIYEADNFGNLFPQNQNSKKNRTFYFYEGVLLRNPKSYTKLKKHKLFGLTGIDKIRALSKFSMIPIKITTLDVPAHHEDLLNWLYDGKKQSMSFDIPLTGTKYTLKNGEIISREVNQNVNFTSNCKFLTKEAIAETENVEEAEDLLNFQNNNEEYSVFDICVTDVSTFENKISKLEEYIFLFLLIDIDPLVKNKKQAKNKANEIVWYSIQYQISISDAIYVLYNINLLNYINSFNIIIRQKVQNLSEEFNLLEKFDTKEEFVNYCRNLNGTLFTKEIPSLDFQTSERDLSEDEYDEEDDDLEKKKGKESNKNKILSEADEFIASHLYLFPSNTSYTQAVKCIEEGWAEMLKDQDIGNLYDSNEELNLEIVKTVLQKIYNSK